MHANFKNTVVINNIFTEVLDPENNTIHKQTIIETFRNVMSLFSPHDLVFSHAKI